MNSFWSLVLGVLIGILFLLTLFGFAQEVKGEMKGASEKFFYLIENGSQMIRENDFEKVFGIIQ
jgi:hypothetical protein